MELTDLIRSSSSKAAESSLTATEVYLRQEADEILATAKEEAAE